MRVLPGQVAHGVTDPAKLVNELVAFGLKRFTRPQARHHGQHQGFERQLELGPGCRVDYFAPMKS